MTVDPRALRTCFGRFVTGVTVITTVPEGGEPLGITANSFSSVSLDPPLVLWCLDKGSDTLDVFEQAGSFAINILASDQQDLSNHYAKAGEHQMIGDWHKGETGCPLLNGAIAHFDCDVHERVDAGDHILFIGKVRYFEAHEGEPLVFAGGQYKQLA